MYYWVNQGKTYKEEKGGGYLWAPVVNKNDNSFFYWESMKKLQPGDIVYNYKKGNLVGYCIIQSKCYRAPQPEEFNTDVEWENNGYMADAEYFLFDKRYSADEIYDKIAHVLPDKYSPLNAVEKDGKLQVKANQGYLYELSQEVGEAIKRYTAIDHEVPFNEDEIIKDENIGYKVPDKTSREGLVVTRVGQGEYRRRILKRWNNKCAVTGCSIKEILIASHIVSWKDSNNQERLDVNNGILLSPTYDALFDRHLISFNDNGKIILSKQIDRSSLPKLGVSGNEEIDGFTEGNQKYLKRHREKMNSL